MMIDKKVFRLLRAFAAESVDEAGVLRQQHVAGAAGKDGSVPEAVGDAAPGTSAELAVQSGEWLAKSKKGLTPPQTAFLSGALMVAALRLDAQAVIAGICAQGGEDLRRALKRVETAELRRLACELTEVAMCLAPGGVLEAVADAASPAKLVLKEKGVALSRLAAWLVQEPRLAQQLLGEDAGAIILEKKPDHHYVPTWFGGAHKKMLPLPELPMFGTLATEAIDSGACSLNYDRLYTLFNVLRRLEEGGGGPFGVVEVGVYKGGTSWFLARLMEALGLRNCTLHACDTFVGHVQEDLVSGVDRYGTGHFVDTSAKAVRALLAPFAFAHIHVGRVQETVDELPQRMGLVHLDTDLYEPTRFGLSHFFDRLVPNGAIVVDDFGAKSCPGVTQAVAEFATERGNAFVLPMLTAQCLVIRSGE